LVDELDSIASFRANEENKTAEIKLTVKSKVSETSGLKI
jgi:hypothetical protein